MDQLPALGTAIGQVVGPTHQLYGNLLQSHAEEIKSTPRKTFTYGSDTRQQLDVYYPKSNPSGTGCPILIFLYGGGLVRGAKILPMIPNEVAYANIGHFFAEKGEFIVVIPDYRLVPQARFPSGGEDLALVIDWVKSNLMGKGEAGKQKDLFIMGNSAGGVHLSTYLLCSAFSESRSQLLPQNEHSSLRLRGAVLLSVPLHFQTADPSRAEILTQYYGERLTEDCPFGLLKAVKDKSTISEAFPGVKFLSMTGTLDPEDEILGANKDFVEAWNAGEPSPDSKLRAEIMEGHNHISPPFALSTNDPKEEAWGFQVVEFCKAARS